MTNAVSEAAERKPASTEREEDSGRYLPPEEKDETMDTEELFTYARARMLQTRAYWGIPVFPEEVEKISTLSELIFWLGNTPFPPDHPGEAAAMSELLTILTTFNPDNLPVLLEYLQKTSSNVSGPSWSSIQVVKDALTHGNSAEARELAGQTLAWEVKRWRPNLRGDIAGWIARHIVET